MNDALVNTAIYVAYFLVGVAVLAVIVFSVLHLITNFKKAKGALLGMGVLVAILLISFGISSNEAYEAHNVGSYASQWIGGGIKATFILIGLAFAAAVYTEVSKLFR